MKWLTTEVYSILYNLTAGLFVAEIFHSWAVFCWAVLCRNISLLGRLLLGCSLQDYFTARPSSAGPFSAEALYRWVIFYKKYFIAGLFLTVCIFIILTYLL